MFDPNLTLSLVLWGPVIMTFVLVAGVATWKKWDLHRDKKTETED
jgi:hypothetical protein